MEKPESNGHPRSLIILRGLPGAGKSTLGALLSEGKYPVFATDDYFTDVNGNYDFDFAKNHLAYKQCTDNVEKEMKKGTSKIFCGNAFTIPWEVEPYFKLAAQYNYSIFVVTVENYHGGKNTHGVPDDQMQKMASKFKVKLLP